MGGRARRSGSRSLSGDLLLHGELGLEALAIAGDSRHCEYTASSPIAHAGIAEFETAIDLDGVPAFRVADIVDGDVVVLAPGERHVRERRKVTDDRAGDGLALPLGHDPVLDVYETAAPRIRPARGIADGEDARGRRLEVRVDDDAPVELESGLLGKRGLGPHTNTGDHEIRGELVAPLEDRGPRCEAAGPPAQVEHDAVLLV